MFENALSDLDSASLALSASMYKAGMSRFSRARPRKLLALAMKNNVVY
jgi:hypothetical protein